MGSELGVWVSGCRKQFYGLKKHTKVVFNYSAVSKCLMVFAFYVLDSGKDILLGAWAEILNIGSKII